MEEFDLLKKRLMNERPNAWVDFPDIEIYKDQLLSYMQRQNISTGADDALTGAMISNYVKMGLMPGPVDKKYEREHIAYLTAIQVLKQVMSVSDTKLLLESQPDIKDTEAFYGDFRLLLDGALNTAATLLDSTDEAALPRGILRIALSAYAGKIIYDSLLSVLREREESRQKNEEEKQKKEKDEKKKAKAD